MPTTDFAAPVRTTSHYHRRDDTNPDQHSNRWHSSHKAAAGQASRPKSAKKKTVAHTHSEWFTSDVDDEPWYALPPEERRSRRQQEGVAFEVAPANRPLRYGSGDKAAGIDFSPERAVYEPVVHYLGEHSGKIPSKYTHKMASPPKRPSAINVNSVEDLESTRDRALHEEDSALKILRKKMLKMIREKNVDIDDLRNELDLEQARLGALELESKNKNAHTAKAAPPKAEVDEDKAKKQRDALRFASHQHEIEEVTSNMDDCYGVAETNDLEDNIREMKDLEIEALKAKIERVQEAMEDMKALINRLRVSPPPKESTVLKMSPEKERWLTSQPDWTKNDAEHRSHAYSDTGLNGPVTNLLKKDGAWNAGGHTGVPQWVVFNLGEDYELSKIEVNHVVNAEECPLQCEFQVSDHGDQWDTVKTWKASESKALEVTEFAPTAGRMWRYVCNNTVGGAKGNNDAGVYVLRMRFWGKKDVPKRPQGFEQSSHGVFTHDHEDEMDHHDYRDHH